MAPALAAAACLQGLEGRLWLSAVLTLVASQRGSATCHPLPSPAIPCHPPSEARPLSTRQKQVQLPAGRHLWWRSAFLMNHARGRWAQAGTELRTLRPSAAVAARVVTTADMVGVHVRNVFDAPRDAATASETLGDAATPSPPVPQRPTLCDALPSMISRPMTL